MTGNFIFSDEPFRVPARNFQNFKILSSFCSSSSPDYISGTCFYMQGLDSIFYGLKCFRVGNSGSVCFDFMQV